MSAQTRVIPYPDNSPADEDFVAMGLSAPDKVYRSEDYKKVIHLLDRIYEADKFSLPRSGSSYSGKIYGRIFSRENFAFLTDPQANLGNQIIDYEKIKGIGYRLLIYYIEDTEPEERFGREVLDCLLLDAWLNMHGVILYDKLAAQLTPEQLGQSNFRRGFDAAAKEYKRSLEEVFYVYENDFVRYDTELLKSFAKEFHIFIDALPERKSSDVYRKRFSSLMKNFPNKEIRKVLKGV